MCSTRRGISEYSMHYSYTTFAPAGEASDAFICRIWYQYYSYVIAIALYLFIDIPYTIPYVEGGVRGALYI